MTTKQSYDNPTSQAERRTTLENERRVARERNASTFHEFAAGDDSGGSFQNQTPRHVVGSTPVPDYKARPNWSDDPTGVEPPTGVAIDQMEPLGTHAEIEQSLRVARSDAGVEPTERQGLASPGGAEALRDGLPRAHASRPRRRSSKQNNG